MKILELVKRLLGIHRPEPDQPDPGDMLAAVIRDALTLNFKFVTGIDMNITVERIKSELYEKFLKLNSRGYISSTYSADEVPCSQFIVPYDCVTLLYTRMKSVHSDIPGDQEGALTLLLDWAEGNLYRMFLPRQGDAGEHLRVKREFHTSDLQAIMWGVSDSVIIIARSGEFAVYITVPDVIWSGLLSSVRDKDFAWRLRSIAVTEYTGETYSVPDEAPLSIDIAKPREFVLGRFFLPALLKVDDTVVSSVFKQISSGTGLPVSGCFNVSLDVKADDGIYRLWYCFEGYGLKTFNDGLVPFDGLFKSILRDTIANLKAACPGLNVSGIRYNTSPAAEPVSDAIMLHSELKVNFKPVNTLIAVPSRFINLVALHILSPWELDLLRSTSRNRILGVLSVNSALFSRGIGSFLNSFRGGSENIPAILSCMPFYEFMELVSDSDLRIIAQNFILPAFSSSYMCLFRIGVADHATPEGAGIKLYTVDSDWKRINKFLPRNILEEAEANLQWTGSEHFDALNRQTMMDLFRAADSDRLVLSARARFILKNQFFDAIEAGYGSELEKLKSSGEPFASLEGLPYNIRQLALSRVSDRDLCLVMHDAGEKGQALTPLLSRARRAKIMEDIEVLKKQFIENRITAGERVRAIHAVMESLEKEKRKG